MATDLVEIKQDEPSKEAVARAADVIGAEEWLRFPPMHCTRWSPIH